MQSAITTGQQLRRYTFDQLIDHIGLTKLNNNKKEKPIQRRVEVFYNKIFRLAILAFRYGTELQSVIFI